MHTALRRGFLPLAVAAACVPAIGAGLFAARAGGAPAAGGATATVHGALAPGGGVAAVTASTDGPVDHAEAADGVSDALGTVDQVRSAVHAGRDGSGSTAWAEVVADGVRLLGGRVVIQHLRVDVTARATAGAARAEVTHLSVDGVTVDGVATAVSAGGALEVSDAGVVHIGETDSAEPGALRVNAVRVTGADPSQGQLVLGHLDVSADPGPALVPPAPAAARPSPDPDLAETPPPADQAPVTTTSPVSPGGPSPVATQPGIPPSFPTGGGAGPTLPRLLPGADPATTAAAVATGGGVFPVAGAAGFIDDYGLPRAGTGWHHGNDIFAAVGTPVVAVADGVVTRVGWNTLGGNRLWLTSVDGNAFYYAHLSAYAPTTVEGASVRAGEVLGYVGNTGQAATTAPHLHFEMHPGGEAAASVDPFPYLTAWRGATAASAGGDGVAGIAPDAAAGAVVVEVAPERDEPPPQQAAVATSAR